MPIVATNISRSGYAYEAAGGHRIINEGQKGITFMSQEGALSRMDFQVVAVKKALGSVSELVDSGHRVACEGKGADIENVHGDTTNLRRCNGMLYLDAWRVPQSIANDGSKFMQLFSKARISDVKETLL